MRYRPIALLLLVLTPFFAHATLISITPCTGVNLVKCEITTTPPAIVSADPNDGILLAWDEKQNITLTSKLYVDRVFDPTASFVGSDSGGFFLKTGTIVSSHYVQWDPDGSSGSVQATINTDSDIFAFIYADLKLFGTDDLLGLDHINYNDFGNRGLEGAGQDTIAFSGGSATIDWYATSPGDWTRMITAYSPAAVTIDEPHTMLLLSLGILLLAIRAKR